VVGQLLPKAVIVGQVIPKAVIVEQVLVNAVVVDQVFVGAVVVNQVFVGAGGRRGFDGGKAAFGGCLAGARRLPPENAVARDGDFLSFARGWRGKEV
jgi:hypothetical protein